MFINLTPHDVNIVTTNGKTITIKRDGTVARIETEYTPIEVAPEDFILYKSVSGRIGGLPNPCYGTSYIVSMAIRNAVPGRDDVFSPGELIRSADGNPIGCQGLVGNFPGR